MKKKNIGSNFEDVLAQDGILEDVQAAAIKAVFADEIRSAMSKSRITEVELPRRMGSTGRSTAGDCSTQRTARQRLSAW